MKTIPLHAKFGVEVDGIRLAEISADRGYGGIRDLFERHSLLLFRDQHLDDAQQLNLGALFGPIEDRSEGANGPDPLVCTVDNLDDDGEVLSEEDLGVARHKCNQQWHTDSSFLPQPALANILRADILPSRGGETEFVSTRAAWRDMPESLKARVRGRVLCHRFTHSVQKVSPELARRHAYAKWADQHWRALWPNPVSGEDALYIASHACGVDGLDEVTGLALIDELIEFATQPQYVYRHAWRAGDVLIWDERATLHRGCPWLYAEPRVLKSICITARDTDGLDRVRPGA